MNSSGCCLLALLSCVLVLLLVDSSSALQNKCVFQCLKGVIKCKRERSLGLLPPAENCCAKYSACYLDCNPNATKMPRCSSKGKRGSWNKRVVGPVLTPRVQQQPTSDLDMPSMAALQLLFDDQEDFE